MAERRITLIAAVARNGIIGRDGTMPWHLPADLAHFKRTTMGHPMIMGRRTWESWGARPLPGRRHLVITRNPRYEAPGAEVVGSLAEALERTEGEHTFIVGGSQIYAEAMDIATDAIISVIPAEPAGDTSFPSWTPGWREVRRQQQDGFEIVEFSHNSVATVS